MAAIIFLYDFKEADAKWLQKETGQFSNLQLIVKASGTKYSTDCNINLPSCPCFEIKQDDLVAAFYQSKLKLDEENIDDVIVVCSEASGTQVQKLCHLFFTPAYKWRIHCPNSATIGSTDYEADEKLKAKVANYLRTLAGDGDVRIKKSTIIPEDVFYHGFSERTGGISTISGMRSLNMVYTTAKKDPRCVIAENRRRLATKVPFDVSRFEIAHAVHGNVIYRIGEDRPEDGYDGVVTSERGMTCAAPGADCIVMLFADPVTRVCGAIHSGWKGTVARICTEMLQAMQDKYQSDPNDVLVVMGPSICEKCFEFSADDVGVFQEISPKCVLSPKQEGKKPTVDLKLANRILLESAGVSPDHIDDSTAARCTVENPQSYFSYRRDGRPFGNQIGFIGLRCALDSSNL